MEMGATAASRAMGVSRGKARYWESKGQDPDFHPGSHGGRRYSTLEPADQIALECGCFFIWKTETGLTDAAVVLHLRALGWVMFCVDVGNVLHLRASCFAVGARP
eukprot:g66964.t1